MFIAGLIEKHAHYDPYRSSQTPEVFHQVQYHVHYTVSSRTPYRLFFEIEFIKEKNSNLLRRFRERDGERERDVLWFPH